MLIQGQAGSLPSSRQTGGAPNAPAGTFGELLVSELNPVYYPLLKAGKVFSLSVAGANPTAFTGGAAGTPLLGVYNPANSGVDIVLLMVKLGIRTTGTAAATAQAFAHWLAAQGSTGPTGTQTQARNLYSGQAVGSVAYGMANTANTGAVASSLVQPSFSAGNIGATAAVNVANLIDEVKGSIVIAPGNYYAYGAVQAFTAGSLDVAAIWAEIPA